MYMRLNTEIHPTSRQSYLKCRCCPPGFVLYLSHKTHCFKAPESVECYPERTQVRNSRGGNCISGELTFGQWCCFWAGESHLVEMHPLRGYSVVFCAASMVVCQTRNLALSDFASLWRKMVPNRTVQRGDSWWWAKELPEGAFGNIWRHLWLSQLGRGYNWPGVLLNVLRCIGILPFLLTQPKHRQ